MTTQTLPYGATKPAETVPLTMDEYRTASTEARRLASLVAARELRALAEADRRSRRATLVAAREKRLALSGLSAERARLWALERLPEPRWGGPLGLELGAREARQLARASAGPESRAGRDASPRMAGSVSR